MLDRLTKLEERYKELERLLADPQVASDPAKLRQYGQELAELEEIVTPYRRYKTVDEELAAAQALLQEEASGEAKAMLKEEIDSLEQEKSRLWEEIKRGLLVSDPRDKKNVILEVRAGTGGEEAALFAADLYRMYTRYAEEHGWSSELLSSNPTGVGGFKEVIFAVRGPGAYSRLKYESGVHRVQRVPTTEASGRIHTSTATVAVLPEVEEVEIKIAPEDLKVEFFRASGHGGQNVQKTSTAVRLTHLPTGMVVACQDERSQIQNRQRAMSILRARLFAMEEEKRQTELTTKRREQVGTGERSEKIRTYNFPQNRVTDHRINLTLHRLPQVLDGDLDEFFEALMAKDLAAQLEGG
ncbi:MAG: peptide chain release factor 1 [Chloroflexi bacterium]|nr:peptide chain release factor 1 [Chloroflexota bacterium]